MFNKSLLLGLVYLSFSATAFAAESCAPPKTVTKVLTVTASAAASKSTSVGSKSGSSNESSSGSKSGSSSNTGSSNNAGSGGATLANAGGSGAASSSTDPQKSTTLDPRVVATGFANNGQGTPTPGQVASDTSTNNFINFCLTVPNLPITNGQQVKTGSCNPAPMGVIAAVTNMPSAKFVSPPNFDTSIQPNTAFTVSLALSHLQAGAFTNAQQTYFAAPQKVNAQGDIIGHTHIVIEALSSLSQTAPTNPQVFAFFKGVDDAADAQGQVHVPVAAGLPAGFYRMCTINSSSNHQPVLVAVAQHGSVDDCSYFTVGKGGSNAAGEDSGAQAAASSLAAAATATAAGKGGEAGTTSSAAAAATSSAAATKGGAASGFALQNGKDALALNAKFAATKNGDKCSGTDPLCAGDQFAQCVNGKVVAQACASGTVCRALPLVNSAGTSVTCDTAADATARIAATGASARRRRGFAVRRQ